MKSTDSRKDRLPMKTKTPLKRYASLKTKVGLTRVAIKRKPKRFPIPKSELAKVDEHSQGKCEYTGYHVCQGKLDYAHIKHRKMGGAQGEFATVINDHRNIAKVCRLIHDIIDGRVTVSYKQNGYRLMIIEVLKCKIGWEEWAEENKEVLMR